jgi:hypothetical protein
VSATTAVGIRGYRSLAASATTANPNSGARPIERRFLIVGEGCIKCIEGGSLRCRFEIVQGHALRVGRVPARSIIPTRHSASPAARGLRMPAPIIPDPIIPGPIIMPGPHPPGLG